MKPPPFEYHRPESVEQALGLLSDHGDDGKLLAGGQSLVPMMNFRIARPAALIDILGLAELSYIRSDAGGSLRIGAATRQVTVERSPLVAAGWPLLTSALECVAHPQIRARGTIGGSLAHADPAAELPVAIAALDGILHVRSVRGERAIGWREFFVAPLQTSIEPDELLVELELPAGSPRAGASFREYAVRHGDFALAGAAALAVAGDDGWCESVSLSLLAAGPAPVRWGAADGIGGELTPALAHDCAERALRDAELSDSAQLPASYRRRLLRGLAAEALLHAAARAGEYAHSAHRGSRERLMLVSLRVNGEPFEGELPPRLSLADLLRDRIGLTGTHLGCEHGICGACTVQVDGEPVRSCLMFAAQADGAEVTTVEALATDETELHPLQRAFHEHHALQCGFCTPGFLMSIEPLLPDVPGMDDVQLRGMLAGNLCRCTGYQPIVEATRATAAAHASARQVAAAAPAPGLTFERLLSLPALTAVLRAHTDGWDVRLAMLDRDERRQIAHLQADARARRGAGRIRAGIELSLDSATGDVHARVSARAFAMQLPLDGSQSQLAAMLSELVATLSDPSPVVASAPSAELTAAGEPSRRSGRPRATRAAAAAAAVVTAVAVGRVIARRRR